MSVITGQGVTAYPLPDEELSPTSKNAVSNEAVCEGLDEIKNTLNHKADVIYDTASRDIASFPDGADGLPVKDLTVGIEPVQSGTGDPSPTNVRPISGWTGCNVSRTGINIFNETWEKGSINSETGAEEPNAYISRTGYISILPSTLYYYTYTDLGNNMMAFYYDLNKNFISSFVAYSNNSFTTPDNAAYLRMHIADGNGIPNTSVNFPYTDHDYHPGTDNVTIPISWQSSAGTVYGGTLDVTSGVLTVTDSLWTKNTSAMNNNENYPGWRAAGIAELIGTGYNNQFDTVMNIGTKYNVNTKNGNDILFLDTIDYGKTQTEWQALAIDVQMVVELAQPQTYQLTPTEVSTLLGQNNIWADCGPVSVEYPCDTKLYIQKINTPTDDDMIADAQIASGKYFIVNNNLYLSTTTILAGDPIKPGTNCTLTNLAAALNALNS